jgi:SNF2 family DNA or RNA helicase
MPHQVEAIKSASGDHPVALFDEQGLGKTKTIINAIINDMRAKLIDGAIIICKKTLLGTWANEIEKHSNLKYMILSGNPQTRRKNTAFFSHIYLINYESLVQEQNSIELLMKLNKFALILDESHRIKNPNSKATGAIFKLKDLSKKNIIITGTPVANKPEDLWSQYYFLDDGKSLGQDFKSFKKEYSFNISGSKDSIDENKLLKLNELIKPTVIRRIKKDVLPSLPKKEYIDIKIKLDSAQRNIYDKLRDDLIIEIKNLDDKEIIDKSENILKKMLRLTQITSNPKLVDRSYLNTPSKFFVLDKLVTEIMGKGEKVIIWTTFVDNIKLLKSRYSNYNALTIFGEMKIVDRNRVVDWFQNDSDYKVLVANPAAAKEGLTLTAANNAIYLDRSFNSVDYIQSQDRIHRISQKRDCKIYKLIAEDTIDEYIDEILSKKNSIAQVIQGDEKSMILPKRLLNKSDLIKILGNYD